MAADIDDRKFVVRDFHSLDAGVFIKFSTHSDLGLYSYCHHQLNESLLAALKLATSIHELNLTLYLLILLWHIV
jgi:hypothetical protein